MCEKCYFGVGGTCLRCHHKKADHDDLLQELRERLAELVWADAQEGQREVLLRKAIEIGDGIRVRSSFWILEKLFNKAFDEIVRDAQRRQEFEVEIFRIHASLDRSDEAMLAHVRDIVAYTLETDFDEKERESGAKLRQGLKIKPSTIAQDAFASAMEDTSRYNDQEIRARWAGLLFDANAK